MVSVSSVTWLCDHHYGVDTVKDPLTMAEIAAGTHYIAYVDIVKVTPGKPRAQALDILRVTVKAHEPGEVVTRAINHLQTFKGR